MEHADQLAFLVDGAEYFHAFRETVKKAQRSVLIIGWDMDSRVELIRGDALEQKTDDLPVRLGDFLNSLLKRNGELQIHVLDWDFTMLFATDREWMPLYKEEWTAHPRLHFHLDDQHPVGACHHQKVVVVDDRVAFVGGLDLTRGRWDTPGHVPDDPRRREAIGEPVPQPYHDIQMMVSGPVAVALGELARARWRRATGQELPPPEIGVDSQDSPGTPDISNAPASQSPRYWPDHVTPDLEDTEVAIARTIPQYNNQPEVREIEQLLLDAIAAAQDSIYIEAQYFTADKISVALEKRLKEHDGPEVVVLLPEHTDGWLSRNTMDVLRERLFKQLKKADHDDRLRLYCPYVPGLNGTCVNVHSKIIIIDHELIRVGSANLNNRSMGLDTECDLVLEANGDARICSAIDAFRTRLLSEHLGMEPGEIEALLLRKGSLIGAIDASRNRLLGEHLGVEPDGMGERLSREGPLIRAIESLCGSGRTLNPVTLRVTPDMDALVPDSQIVDPDHPIEADQLIEEFVPEEQREPARHHIALVVTILAAVLGLTAAWHWSPLREWANVDTLIALAAAFQQTPAAPLLALGIFIIGGLIAFPLTVLVIACVLVFGPWHGFLYALLDAMASAIVTYGVGRFLGRNTVRRFAGKKLKKLNRRLARRGLLTIIIVRIIPVAPFTVINMVAGASQIRFWDFVLGSAIGLLPGLVGISLFTDRLAATIQKPDLPAFALLAVIIAALTAGGWAFWRWEKQRRSTRLRAQAD